MRKIIYIPLENILADDPLSRMSIKGWILIAEEAVSSRFDKFTLASTAHERNTLATLVSHKHNVAAKHGSSMPLTFTELWLLEFRIRSTRKLPPYPMHYGLCANRLLITLQQNDMLSFHRHRWCAFWQKTDMFFIK